MIFIDLLASLVGRLSSQAEPSASSGGRSDPGAPLRLAIIDLSSAGEAAHCSIDGVDSICALDPSALGIVGQHATSAEVFGLARNVLGGRVVFCNSSDLRPTDPEQGSPSMNVTEGARAQPLFCIALPWSAEAARWLSWHRTAQTLPGKVIVAWRHCSAVERALAYLGRHVAEPVQLADLAGEAGISKFQLLRSFRATIGITPHRCQLMLRIAQAKALLREGWEIADIAVVLGFFDQSHLHRTFKMLAGTSPGRYQAAARNFLQDRKAVAN
jgi:AraC-like DNA-binding protein